MTFSETSTELFQSFKLDNLFYILISMSLFYFLAPSFLNCRLQPHMRSYNGWNVGVGNHLSTVQFFWMCNKQNLILSQMLTNPRCVWQHLPMLLASYTFTVLFWTHNMHTTLWMQHTQGQWILLEWKRCRLKTTVMNYSIYKLYIQTFLLSQKHGGLIMEN